MPRLDERWLCRHCFRDVTKIVTESARGNARRKAVMERALMAVADGMHPYKRRRTDPAVPGTETNPLFPPVAFDNVGMGEHVGSGINEDEAVDEDGEDTEMAAYNLSSSNIAAGQAEDDIKGADAPRDALPSVSPTSSRSASPPSCAIGSPSGSTMNVASTMMAPAHRQHGGRRTPEVQGHRQPLSSPSSAAGRSRRNLAKISR